MAHFRFAEVAVPADSSDETQLNRSPPPQPFVEGMRLGTGIDAITGEQVSSAIDVNVEDEIPRPSNTTGHTSLHWYDDVRELQNTTEIGFQASVAAPVDGVNVKGSLGFDFSNSTSSTSHSIFMCLTWEKNGGSVGFDTDGFTFKDDALAALEDGTFRQKYGDYFVYEITNRMKFTAVWKCSSHSKESLENFKISVGAAASVQEDIGGDAAFHVAVSTASKKHNITFDSYISLIGDSTGADINPKTPDIESALADFQEHGKPAPSEVLLRHWSHINTDVPTKIPVPYERFKALATTFSAARYALVLNSVAPGKASVREDRKDRIYDIYTDLINARATGQAEETIDTLFGQLQSEISYLRILLDREDLVLELRNMTYEDLKRNFHTSWYDDNGDWVVSTKADHTWTLGRVDYDDVELALYAVQVSDEIKVSAEYKTRDVNWGNLIWDGKFKGTAVGIQVIANWTDGTDGSWCIPQENPLGTKHVNIQIVSEKGRGYDWSLYVTYIPDADYYGK